MENWKRLRKNPKEKTSGKAKLSNCKDLMSSFVQFTKKKNVPRHGCRKVFAFPREVLNNKRVFNPVEETITNAGDRSQAALTGNKGFIFKNEPFITGIR